MTEQGMSRGEWIRWLGEAISTECEKPFEEIDYDFVEECGRLLDELMESTAAIPTEELRERLAKVKPGAGSGSDKKTAGNHRRLWTVAIAAAVVLCMSITVLAVPAWRTALLTALRLDVGESVEDNGIVYMNAGEIKYYENMGDLISTENIDILLYDDPHKNLKIKNVIYMKNTHSTILSFNDETINFKIYHDVNTVDKSMQQKTEKYTYTHFDAYVFQKEQLNITEYSAHFYYNRSTYVLNCQSEEILFIILDSLKVQGD